MTTRKILFIILTLFVSSRVFSQTSPATPAPTSPQQMNTNTVYQDAVTKKYYVYNGSVFGWRQLTDSLQVKRMIAALGGGSVTSITPGLGLTPNTPITTAGTINVDTAFFSSIYAKLVGGNNLNGNQSINGNINMAFPKRLIFYGNASDTSSFVDYSGLHLGTVANITRQGATAQFDAAGAYSFRINTIPQLEMTSGGGGNIGHNSWLFDGRIQSTNAPSLPNDVLRYQDIFNGAMPEIDADFQASINTIYTLSSVTANRLIRFDYPTSPSLNPGKMLRFWNTNTSTSFSWMIGGAYAANVLDVGGAPLTKLVNNAFYTIISDGTNWVTQSIQYMGNTPAKIDSAINTRVKNSNTGTNQDSVGHGSQMGTQFKADQTIAGATQILNNKGATLIVNSYSGTNAGSDTALNRNNVLTLWRHSTQPYQPSALTMWDSIGREVYATGWAQIPFTGYGTAYSQAYGNSVFWTGSNAYSYGFITNNKHTQPPRQTLVFEGLRPDGTSGVGAWLTHESNSDTRFFNAYRDSVLTFNGATGNGIFYKPVNFNQQVSFSTSLSNLQLTGATAFLNSQAVFSTTNSTPVDYSTTSTGTGYPLNSAGNRVFQGRSTAARDFVWVNGTTPSVKMYLLGSDGSLNIGYTDGASHGGLLAVSGTIAGTTLNATTINASGAGTIGTFLNFTNSQIAYSTTNSNPIIFSTSTGGPFPDAGNFVFQGRSSAGNARDIIFATGSTPSAALVVDRNRAISFPNYTTGGILHNTVTTGLITSSLIQSADLASSLALPGTPTVTTPAFSTTASSIVNQAYLPTAMPVILATITGINAKTTGTTAVYTVPTGKTAVVTGFIVRCTAASAITIGPSVSVTSTTGTVYANTALTGLTTANTTFSFGNGISVSPVAADVINFVIGTAATGTSQTVEVSIIGYLR